MADTPNVPMVGPLETLAQCSDPTRGLARLSSSARPTSRGPRRGRNVSRQCAACCCSPPSRPQHPRRAPSDVEPPTLAVTSVSQHNQPNGPTASVQRLRLGTSPQAPPLVETGKWQKEETLPLAADHAGADAPREVRTCAGDHLTS